MTEAFSAIRPSTIPGSISIPDGSLEAMKWLGLLLMTGDHVNKYLFNGTLPVLFELGRLALPLFIFVLAYNLARDTALARGVYFRTLWRMGVFGLLATGPFIALGGLAQGWWPLNVMFTLMAATATIYLIEKNGPASWIAAGAVFLFSGACVEFGWPAIAGAVAVWWFCKRPSAIALGAALVACASLYVVNQNYWAFSAVLVIVIGSHVNLRVPRLRWAFYVYYPLHLVAFWLLRIPMRNAGYLFF